MRRGNERRHHRAPLLALMVLMLFAAVTSACSNGADDDGGDADGTESTDTSVAAQTTVPEGMPTGAVEAGLRDLEIGQCFETIDDPIAADVAVWLLDCALPHTFEVFDLVEFEEGGGASYPGTIEVQESSEAACHDRFEAFVGRRWTLSELDIQLWWPTEESWGRGDRTIICTVLEDSGAEVTGTLRGADR